MKKMWKKNNKAVSPVIATILMVAITVVLAAVLYVMVMGFGGDGGGQAPTASLTNSGNRLVLSINQAYDIEDGMSLTFKINGTAVDIGTVTEGTGAAADTYVIGEESDVIFVDAGGDGKISSQDYFTTTSPDNVVVQVIWSSGGTNTVVAEKII